MSFPTESQLLNTTLGSTALRWLIQAEPYPIVHRLELQGLFGIPDLVVAALSANGTSVVKSVAFEMKLHNWNRALAQAYRYKSFADSAFVVMDQAYVHRALSKVELFERSNVGLLGVNRRGDIWVHYMPREESPYCSFLQAHFLQLIADDVTADRQTDDPTRAFVPLAKPADWREAWLDGQLVAL